MRVCVQPCDNKIQENKAAILYMADLISQRKCFLSGDCIRIRCLEVYIFRIYAALRNVLSEKHSSFAKQTSGHKYHMTIFGQLVV